MAQFLSMIDKKVQEELNKRTRKIGDKKLEPTKGPNAETGGIYNRSTWIRVIPNTILTNKKTKKQLDRPILMGGVLYNKDGKKTASGEPITGSPKGGIGGQKGLYTGRTDKTWLGNELASGGAHKPSPGVTSIDIKSKGDLGSLTECSIKWNCWSFDQLDEMAYYFMRPGASIIVEFGWSGTEYDPAPHSNPEEAMFNKRKWLNPNMEFFCGIISNFEWTGRDDGGFDCTTTVTAGGSLLAQQEIKTTSIKPSSAAEKGFTNLRDFFVLDGGQQFYDFVLDACYTLKSSTSEKNTYSMKDGYSGTWFAKFKDPDNSQEMNWHVFATIGWLEDNIFSKFLGMVSTTGDKKSMEFRSIEENLREGKFNADGVNTSYYTSTKIKGHKYIVSTNPLMVFIPNRHLNNTLKIGEMKTTERWWWWDSKDWSATIPEFKWTSNFNTIDYYAESDKDNVWYNKNSDTVFNYRNIVVSNHLLHQCCKKAETINDFFSIFFDSINGFCGSMWNFRMITDDDNTCRVKCVDLNFCETEVREALGKTSEEGEDSVPVYRAYVFPAMSRNSIVKQQSLNMRIPDAAALTAMYGTNSGESDALVNPNYGGTGEGGGGSGQHSDIVMNALGAISSGDVDVKAEDELLKGMATPASNYGSGNPYTNVGSDKNRIKEYQGNGIGMSLYKENENNGQLLKNSDAPWSGKSFVSGKTVEANKNSTNEKGQDANSKVDNDKDKFKTSDKAVDLAKILEDEEANLPDSLTHDKLMKKAFGSNWKNYELEDNPTNAKKFFAAFSEVVWTQLENSGGGWIIPPSLRNYFWWTIKFNEPEDDKKQDPDSPPGMATKTSYMLPLELELTVDGIGGIQYGNAFQSEYVPQKYIDTTLFQATEINHTVGIDGWTTTLKGKMRLLELEELRNQNRDED